jgi:hypothetical protein
MSGLFTFTVTPDGTESYELAATSRDVLNWEKTTKGASLGKFESDPTIQDVYKIAFFAAKRTGQFSGTLPEFEASHDLEFDMEDKADPTQRGRTREQSRSSQ